VSRLRDHKHKNIVALLTDHPSQTVKPDCTQRGRSAGPKQISSKRCTKRPIIAAARGHYVVCRRTVNGTTG
jgi:hypothetical protein